MAANTKSARSTDLSGRGTHLCMAESCQMQTSSHLVFCGPHWRMIPADLQKRLYQASESGVRADWWVVVSECKQAIRQSTAPSPTLNRVLITGKTYPVREELKALGGEWDAGLKGWWVPAEMKLRAEVLVGNADASGDLFADDGFDPREHLTREDFDREGYHGR